MKNVAILTLPLTNYNYGGLLQAYALQTYIRENYNVEVQHIDRQYNLSKIIGFKSKLYKLINYPYTEKINAYNAPIKKFIDAHIRVSKAFTSQAAFIKYLNRNKIDLLITGSDQVWNKNYAYNIHEDLILDIPYQATKISYAASFGANHYADLELLSKISKLDGISVREADAKTMLNNKCIDAKHHIDPTLLLEADVYKKLAQKSKKNFPHEISAYVLDKNPETEEFLKEIQSITGKNLNKVGDKIKITKSNYKNIHQVADSVEDWLNAFYQAEYVITDSFHGCVFSILFNKQFVTLGNKKRGLDRFNSLLSLFGLEDRLISSKGELSKILTPIDYQKINQRLNELREESKQYFDAFLIQ